MNRRFWNVEAFRDDVKTCAVEIVLTNPVVAETFENTFEKNILETPCPSPENRLLIKSAVKLLTRSVCAERH